MKKSSTENSLVFLLGAGFNVDAASEAGNPMALSSRRPAKYPLVHELMDICFGIDDLPNGKSIEDMFQESIDNHNGQPIEKLYDLLMEADYYITPHLIKQGKTHQDNLYLKFLRDFPKAPLLTFNYDSLPEILLLSECSWRPEDGYGVRVRAECGPTIRDKTLIADSSLRPVLHLHGSLCVYPSTFYVEKQPGLKINLLQFKENPDFSFDPDAIGACFSPFEGILSDINYTSVLNRVIAPVPNKAEGLRGKFIEAVYKQAIKLFQSADQIISVGYSFNTNDRSSYDKLFTSVTDKKVVLIVAPEAESIKECLSHKYSNIQYETQSMTFREWVDKNYLGVRK